MSDLDVTVQWVECNSCGGWIHQNFFVRDLTTKSHPYVSAFTLVAYQQILFNAYLLICDIHCREPVSHNASKFKNDAAKSDYLTKLMDCYVPDELATLISQLAPTYDPQRKLMFYIPSFAGFSFAHDYGRTVPPCLMILAHNLLASLRTNADPEDTLRTFYSTTVLTIDNEHFTPAHFLGGYYLSNGRVTCHPNWLNTRFEKVYNPVIGRALIQRPTLAKTRLQSYEYDNPQSVDPYEFLLCYSEENIEVMFDLLSDISSFISKEIPSSRKLGQLLGEPSGVNILYHSIWSFVIPTWHSLPPAPASTPENTSTVTDKAYVTSIKYLSSAPIYKSSLVPPPESINAVFYLVGKNPYDKNSPPFHYDTFDRRKHVHPDVFWFQPYIQNPSAINYSLTLGLLIEQGDIDGTTIPLPNIAMSLTENNSMFMQGCLPITHVLSVSPNFNENSRFHLPIRKIHDSDPVGIALRDSSTVMLPQFGTAHVRSNMNRFYGPTVRENCNDNHVNFTYSAWPSGSIPSIPPGLTYLWSSYRYVHHAHRVQKKIHFYYTMRQFYGENVTLSRTRNPTLLLPS